MNLSKLFKTSEKQRGSVDWEMQQKRARKDLLLALLVGTIIFVAVLIVFKKQESESDLVQIVSIKTAIESPKTLTEADLIYASVPRSLVADSILTDMAGAIGASTIKAMSEKEWLSEEDLVRDVDPSSESLLIPGDRVGVSLPSAWFVSPIPKLRKRDRITILGSFPDQDVGGGTGIVFSNVEILEVKYGKDSSAPAKIFVAVDMEQAATIAQAKTNKLNMVVLLQPIGSIIQNGEEEIIEDIPAANLDNSQNGNESLPPQEIFLPTEQPVL